MTRDNTIVSQDGAAPYRAGTAMTAAFAPVVRETSAVCPKNGGQPSYEAP